MSSIFRLSTVCIVTALVPLAFACAGSDDARPTNEDAGDSTSPDGTPAPVSNEDAGVDAAPVRECSDDGVCHTAVPEGQTLRAVWGDGQGVVWAVSGQGAILRWEGSEWTIHASGLGPLSAIWGSGPTDVWVGGASVLFHGTGSSPDTLTFAPTQRPRGDVTSIWGASASDVWAVAISYQDEPRSRVLHYAPGVGGTAAWSEVAVTEDPSEVLFTHVWGTAASGVWLGGTVGGPWTPGRLYRRPQGASEFEPVLAPSDPEMPAEPYDPGELMSVSVISGTRMVLLARTLAGDETLVHATTTDGGQTFTLDRAELGEFNGLWSYAVAGTADDLWVAGEYGRMRRWNGSAWTASTLSVTKYPVISDFFAFWVKAPNDLWVVGDGIALHLDPTRKK